MAVYLPAPEGDKSPGVASGGLKGQYLRKASDLDYDTDWEDVVAGEGGGGSSATNLSYDAATRTIASDTGADATLPLVTDSEAGLVPATGGGTTNFLRADGTFAAPPSSPPGGTSGQIQFNDGGSFGGVASSSVDVDGNVTIRTATVNAPSGYTGNLLDLQQNGTSRARISASTGELVLTNTSSTAAWISSASQFRAATVHIGFNGGPGIGVGFGPSSGSVLTATGPSGYMVGPSAYYGWSPGTLAQNPDVTLYRDAADTLAQRRTTNAQTFRVYNTYTSSTNFERANLGWSGNVFLVGTEKGSAGGTARQLEFQTDGVTRVTVTTNSISTSGTVSNHLLTPSLNINSQYGQPALQGGAGATNDGIIFSKRNNGLMYTFAPGAFEIRSSAGANGVSFTVEAQGQLGQRLGTNAQAYRLYNTYTSSTNYERANLGWDGNVFLVGTEKGSAGGTARQLEFQTDGTSKVAITTDGKVGIGTTSPSASLELDAPSGYTGNLLDLQVGGTSKFTVDENGKIINGTPSLSAYKSGNWIAPYIEVANGATSGGNTIWFVPFFVWRSITVTELGARVTSISAGNTFDLAIYAADADGNPTGLPLTSCVNLSLDVATTVSSSVDTCTLNAGQLYYGAMNRTATAAFQRPGGIACGNILGSSDLSQLSSNSTTISSYVPRINYTAGSWPDVTSATFTTSFEISRSAAVFLKVGDLL